MFDKSLSYAYGSGGSFPVTNLGEGTIEEKSIACY